jgi:two-component system, cell cycle sensor histidine kinase and response regulator CckA
MTKVMSRAELETRIGQLEKEVAEAASLRDALYQAEAKYRLLVENANDAIFILQDGRVKYANPKALAMASTMTEELQHAHYSKFLHPEDRDMVVERHEKRLQGEKILNMYPLRIVNNRGETIWTEVNVVVIEWENRPATLNIIRDISAQKLAEKQLLQTEGISTLRTMAGGLAHSFNNLLMGIQGRASLLQKHPSQDSEFHHLLEGIEQCVNEAAGLTRQMLGFAQTGKYQVVRMSLNTVVKDIVKSALLNVKSIELDLRLAPDLLLIEADCNQIEQAVMNIVLNARQAMFEFGTITVATENIEWKEGRGRFHQLPADRYVKLTVRDTGAGMDEQVRKRAFEPFFTTKGVGEHRGLGLSRVYGIITNHNGWVDIESLPQAGTTVSLYLPAL